nr:hypothetical protein [Tanacetum cinerariifolium]
MADLRTMAQLLQAPTEGYEDAIVVPEITADNFELKDGLLTLVQNKQFFGHDKEDPHAHIRYSNKITSTLKFSNVSNTEAWDRFKDLLRAFPHHGFSKLHQLDTFYNALNSKDQDSLNSTAGDNFLDKIPRECLVIIESKSKVRYSRNKPVVAKVSTNTSTSGISPDVAELKDMVKALLLDMKSQNQAPTTMKAVEESFNYNQGNTSYRPPMMSNQIRPPVFPPVPNNQNVQLNQRNNQNHFNQNQNRGNNFNHGPVYQPLVFQPPAYQAPTYQAPAPQIQGVSKEDFSTYVKANDAVMRNMQPQGHIMQNQLTNLTNLLTKFVNFNNASTSSSGTLPRNTIANPKSDLKAITTRSGVSYDGPQIPPSPSFLPKVVENKPKATKDIMHPTNNGSTEDVQPQGVHSESLILTSEPVNSPISKPVTSHVSSLRPNQRPSIPYPSRMQDQKLRDKVNDQREKILQIFKDLNLNISFANALILMPKFGPLIKSLLTNKDKLSLVDLGASINLMPLSLWNKLSLPDLTHMCMTLELVDRLISRPVRVAEDVYVKIDLSLRSEELLLMCSKVNLPFPLVKRPLLSISIIDMACEEYSQEVLGFSNVIASGNPTPYYDPIVSTTFLTLTSFRNSDFLLEEVDAFLGIEDDPTSPEPLEVELKDLPPHLEYAFLEGDNKLSVIIAKDLSVEEKTALITVLKSHKGAIAWKLSDIKDAADSGPIFDDEPLQKVSNDDHYNVFAIESTHPEQSKSIHDTYPIEQDAQNVIIDSLDMSYDREEIDQNDDDNDLAKEHELLASLIKKLKCETDESKNHNKFLETSNMALIEKLKREIEDFKNKNKSLESSNIFFKEANNRLFETNNLLYADYIKSEVELARRNSKEYASQMELECAKVKEAQIKLYKTREDKELDKVIELENKVKVLDNIVYKTGQSVQTMNMVNNKCQTSFVKPEFLEKAKRANPRLYDRGCYNDNLALMLTTDSDKVICLEKESRSKLSDLIRPFDYDKLNNLISARLNQFLRCLNEEMVADLRYFNSLESEVDSLRSQLKAQKTQFLNEIDRLSREYYYVNHMNAILGVYTELDEVTNLQCDYLELLEKYEGLEIVLSKSKIMSKSFESVQKHTINLELELQQCKEKIKNDMLFKVNKSKDFCKEREQYFEIQDLKAQLQDKGIVIITQTHVSNDFSKLVTAQTLPTNKKSILKNRNVLAPKMYKLHTDHTQTRTSQLPQDFRKTNKRVSFSTGVIPTTSVSRPLLKSNLQGDKVMHNNSQGKKQEVEDHRRSVNLSKNKTFVTACNDSMNAKTLNVKSISAMCDKCMLIDKHDMCVLKSVAKPLKETVALESNKKPRNFTRKLYERVSKTCSWWYPKFTPSGYIWKPKFEKENVNPNVSMPLGNASRTDNVMDTMTYRCSTVSNTPLSSNSFVARRDYPIHR